MARLQNEYSLEELSQTLEVSRSGFVAHTRKASVPRRQRDRQLVGLLQTIFTQSRRTYGSPRLCAALRQNGERCGKNRVHRLMREQGWRARQKKRWRPGTTDSRHGLPVAPNRLAQSQEPQGPNRVWQSDITYLRTAQGWVYLAVTLDRFSRRVVGWQLKPTLETPLVTEALDRAQKERVPLPGLLHHSDRGVQYVSGSFQQRLQTHGMEASMSRKGNCYDNALAESFFATLKTECLGSHLPATCQEARTMVFDYIETFYNPKRLHSALGFKSPVDFERQFH